MPGCSGVAKAGVTGTQDGLGPVGDLELAKMLEIWFATVLALTASAWAIC